jgi:stalled ribosome alternative rescue factor ArfA
VDEQGVAGMVLTQEIEIQNSLASDSLRCRGVGLEIEGQPLFRHRGDHAKKGRASGNLQDSRQLDRARRVSRVVWHVGYQASMDRVVRRGPFS